ncbi:hypothetical protein [Qipengyuania sediminis]|uniref:hypothetical protein n=1 Tax=Qipengyuania sediminis TaxID=1532023 RepID=UPI001059CDD3|nr:hypothetical protein [Qipengyuania sediminis]
MKNRSDAQTHIIRRDPVFHARRLRGPREQAGEVSDSQAGVVDSEDSIESGPAESMGERRDEATEAANKGREARADALEEQADGQREESGRQAEALDQAPDRVREGR